MSEFYEIRVKGHLDPRWGRYFEGMKMSLLSDGETAFSGEVVDQAALHSLLSRIRDLGLTLELVRHVQRSNRTNLLVITNSERK